MFIGSEPAKKKIPKRFQQVQNNQFFGNQNDASTDKSTLRSNRNDSKKPFQNSFSNSSSSSKHFFENIPLAVIKNSLVNGKFVFSSKNLENLPNFLLTINRDIDENIKKLDPDYEWYAANFITSIDLAYNKLTTLPTNISGLADLTHLNLLDNNLTIDNSNIQEFNQVFKHLSNLTSLNLANNSIQIVPESVLNHENISILNLHHNMISEPEMVLNLPNLREISIADNKIPKIILGNLSKVAKIDLSKNQIKRIEFNPAFTNLNNLSSLDLSTNKIENFDIFEEKLKNICILVLKRNLINKMPKLNYCEKLVNLNISENRIFELGGDVLEYLPAGISVFEMASNRVGIFPDSISNLKQLTRLDISSNDLRKLPPEIALCDKLTQFTISGNPLRTMRSILDKNSFEIIKYLKERLPEDKLYSLENNMTGISIAKSNVNNENQAFSGVNTNNQTAAPISKSQISLNGQKLKSIGEFIEKIPNLEKSKVNALDISRNNLICLDLIQNFNNLTSLNLSVNYLTDCIFKDQIFLPESVHTLILNNNNLTFGESEKSNFFEYFTTNCKLTLTTLLLSSNKLEQIPVQNFLNFKNLVTLDLSNNSIKQIPPILGKFKNMKMRHLKIDGNLFRVPRINIINQGSDSVLAYLFDRIPL